jgi:hypothetical protein
LIDTCAWIDVEQGTLTPADVGTLTRDEPVFLSPFVGWARRKIQNVAVAFSIHSQGLRIPP